MKVVNLCELFMWKFFVLCLRSVGIINGLVYGLLMLFYNFFF